MTGLERDARGWKVTAAGPDSTLSIHADTVMIAAGVWTTDVGALAGADLPTIRLALMMSVSAPVEPFIGHLIQHAGAKLSLKQTKDGTVLIGGGWPAALSRRAGSPDLETRPRLLPESIVGNARAAIGVVPGTARTAHRAVLGGDHDGHAGSAATRGRGARMPGDVRGHRRIGLHARAELRPFPLRPGAPVAHPTSTCGPTPRTDSESWHERPAPRLSRGAAATDVSFVVDGLSVRAAAGETVAAAMLAEAERCFARRGGEQRAPLCNMGTCFECAITVDGVPMTRTCLTTVRDGMTCGPTQ